MELWKPDRIVLPFPSTNPYTHKTTLPTPLQEVVLFELNEKLLDIQEDSHMPIESDLYLHYHWKLKQIGGES